MGIIMPGSVQRNHTEAAYSAVSAFADLDVMDGADEAAEVFELSLDLGVDLFAYADELIGESDAERTARLAAAADILADDPTLYPRVLKAAADLLDTDRHEFPLTLPAAFAGQDWRAAA
ncbi:hypothetical protein [Streptomyces sp. NPDC051993]|uniref:hypothetical protein n=1 Tax=Streptomyces sp. NPDC051993 TaxID=3155286 RepID=UPI0034345AAE